MAGNGSIAPNMGIALAYGVLIRFDFVSQLLAWIHACCMRPAAVLSLLLCMMHIFFFISYRLRCYDRSNFERGIRGIPFIF